MHLVGFVIRIYHNAQSPERQFVDFNLCIFGNKGEDERSCADW